MNSSPTRLVRSSVTTRKTTPRSRKKAVCKPRPLQLVDVFRRVRNIRTLAYNREFECAHTEESSLYHDFARAVAEAEPRDARRVTLLARAILETESIHFTRYFA